MRNRARWALALVASFLCLCGGTGQVLGQESNGPEDAAPAPSLTLIPERVLDGRGELLEGTSVRVVGTRIAAVGPVGTAAEDGDVLALPGLTLLPGLIDTHVHIGWHFDLDGRSHSSQSVESAELTMAFAMENAYRTVMGGVTTVQSLGSEIDLELRRVMEHGVIPGPRILTSVESLFAGSGDADEMRARVRELSERGADVIKLFASASIRDGGTPTMSQAQLDAACGEAQRVGLRAVVHAHGPESVRRSVEAGCTTIEHGALLDRETLELLAERGVYYDPHIDLVLRNYFENKDRFLGIGNYTVEGFAQMRAAVPKVLAAFQTALEVPGLNVLFGTDAIAGSHGRNVEELIYRMEVGGQSPMAAIVSATSLAAESLRLGDRIGSIRAGYEADLIAVQGNPLEDPSALGRVVFVMRGGRLVLQPPGSSHAPPGSEGD